MRRLHGHFKIIAVCSGQMRKVGEKLHLKAKDSGTLIFTINLKFVQTFTSVLRWEVIVLSTIHLRSLIHSATAAKSENRLSVGK